MDRMPLGLVERWTVLEDDQKLIAGKRGRRGWVSRCCLSSSASTGGFPSAGRSCLTRSGTGTKSARNCSAGAGRIGWAGMLGPADRRGLTPLFWQHVRPYGQVRLDMGARLRIGGAG
jgi:hypothetical protein